MDRRGEATFYVWQKAPPGFTGEDVARRFLEVGVVVTPGAWISDETAAGVNPGRDYARLAPVPPGRRPG